MAMDFELPLLDGSTEIGEAFKVMIEQDVSGIVAETSSGYRLIHYCQVLAATEAGNQYIADIPSYLPLDRPSAQSEYSLQSIQSTLPSLRKAIIQSRRERGSHTFRAQSPGYSCNARPRHYYPPNKRGTTNDCTVLGCTGKIP